MSETLDQFEGRLIKEIAKVHQSSRLEAMMENMSNDMRGMREDLKEIKNAKTADAVWKTNQENRLLEGNKRFEAQEHKIEKLDQEKLDKKTVYWVGLGFLLANVGLTAGVVKMLTGL